MVIHGAIGIQDFLSTVIVPTITELTLFFHSLWKLWTPMDYQHEYGVTEVVKIFKWHSLCSRIHYEGQKEVALFVDAVSTISELNASAFGEIFLQVANL